MSRSWWWRVSSYPPHSLSLPRIARAVRGIFICVLRADPCAGRIADIGLKPPGDPPPRMAQGLAAHEQTEVTARLAGPFQPRRLRAQQPRRRERLIAWDDDIVLAGQQENRHAHLGEIDPAAERDKAASGDQVLSENLLGHLKIVGPWQIQRRAVPALETIQQPRGLVRSIAEIPLQHRFHVLLAERNVPDPQHVLAADDSGALAHHLLESWLRKCGHHPREF